MAASTMNLQMQQSLVGKFARRQPFRGATRAPLHLVRGQDPISPDEGPVSAEIIGCEHLLNVPSLRLHLHAMEGVLFGVLHTVIIGNCACRC